jgi:hypothetical protein
MKISNQPDLSSPSAPIEQHLSLNDLSVRFDILLIINSYLTVFTDLLALYDMPEDLVGHQPHLFSPLLPGMTAKLSHDVDMAVITPPQVFLKRREGESL